MTDLAFGAGDCKGVGMSSEDGSNCLRLCDVALWRAGPVCIDVVNMFGVYFSIFQGCRDGPGCSGTRGSGFVRWVASEDRP